MNRVCTPLAAAAGRRALLAQRALSGAPKSAFENYDTTSAVYDAARRPIAIEHLRATLTDLSAAHGVAMGAGGGMRVLDAGCGTGNYLVPLNSMLGAGAVSGIEASSGMLAKAQAKFADGEVDLAQGSIMKMPHADETFHAVVINQVLHHLTLGERSEKGGVEWDALESAIAEVVRVLKPGGALVVNTQDPVQHVDGFWWSDICPNAAATLASRFPAVPAFVERLDAHGFERAVSHVPSEPLMALEVYTDVTGPFRESWRNGDSTWSLATPAELERGLAEHRARVDAGEAEHFLAERELLRADVGQTTTITAFKKQ